MFLRKVTLLMEKIKNPRKYPFTIPTIRNLDSLEFSRDVTFFVGENGSGKSTLLEAIAYNCGFNPAGGGRNNVYDLESSQAILGDYLRLSWLPKVTQGFFLRAESFYHFASYLDQMAIDNPQFKKEIFDSYGGKSLHEQSHGESFLTLFANRFGKKGIYLLDEPEAALSPARQLALMRLIRKLEKGGKAQFIIATHSPILLGYPDAQILNFDTVPISEMKYEETDHYLITKGFLNRREKFLEELFQNDEKD